MSLRRLVYHGAVYGLTTATARLLNWLLTPLYVHRLPIEEYGRLSELYSWMVFGLIATGLGMETAYFRFARKDALGATFWRILGLFLFITVGLNGGIALVVPVLAPSLGYAGREELLWLTVAIWTVDAWGSFVLAHQRAIGAPLRFALIQLSHVFFFLLMNIWGVGVKGYGLEFILWANLMASLIRLGWGMAWAPPMRREDSAPSSSTLLRYGLSIAFMGLLGATNDVLDRILLARHSLVETALYGAAYKVAMALALFVQAYRQAGEPLLLGEYRGDERFFQRSWLLYHGTALMGLTLLGLWMRPFLTTTWGGWLRRPIFPEVYHSALGVVPILLWANLLAGSLIQASIWYKSRVLPVAGLVITGIGSFITWVGNLYGIPRLGYVASAWTTLAAYGAMVVISLTWGYGWRKVLTLFVPLSLPILISIGGTIAGLMLSDPGLEANLLRLVGSVIAVGGISGTLYSYLSRKR
ncbi:MAG: hypothetical protein NZZ60_05940 [Bacteroidia bacterium]|nr:hypothetical protein [Bacteroidia bacterium]MCX7652585.1 hypothetical protein [Bacteroidia bacterium]MDW8417175.1 hypothetical protein [Bacteroidia bacterium]